MWYNSDREFRQVDMLRRVVFKFLDSSPNNWEKRRKFGKTLNEIEIQSLRFHGYKILHNIVFVVAKKKKS